MCWQVASLSPVTDFQILDFLYWSPHTSRVFALLGENGHFGIRKDLPDEEHRSDLCLRPSFLATTARSISTSWPQLR